MALAALLGGGRPCGAQELNVAKQVHYLKSTGRGFGDQFGSSVAASGDRVVVGAPFFQDPGAVFVYRRVSDTTWVFEAELKASNGELGEGFGFSVAISGDTIAVGSPGEGSGSPGVNGDQSDNSTPGAGAVYVFEYSGGTWTQQAYLKASNPDAGDQFGESVALDDDTIVVGTSFEDSGSVNDPTDDSASLAGAAYVFERTGSGWIQSAYLKASNVEAGDGFGQSVDVSGDTIVVGACCEDSNGPPQDNSGHNPGAAYVFQRVGVLWFEVAYLKSPNPAISGFFGSAVAVDGDRLIVGAVGTATVHVFERSRGADWTEVASWSKVVGDYARCVDVVGDVIVVGARTEAGAATGINGDESLTGFPSGAAYVYRRFGGTWMQAAYVKASNPEGGDLFGWSVAVSPEALIVGAPVESSDASGIDGDQTNNNAPASGAAYLFAGLAGPLTYCTGKLGGVGCATRIDTSPAALNPVSGAADYAVTAVAVQELQDGIVFGGIGGPANFPFSGGGTLCIQPPLKRGPLVPSGGIDANSCSGTLSTIVNDGLGLPPGLDPGPGNTAWYQYWVRAPANGVLGFALSDAVQLDFR